MNGIEELPFDCNGVLLKPIKGIKVTFMESRHFIVAKNYPDSDKIFRAMQKGMKILRNKGEFEKAHYPIAINQAMIASWQNLLTHQP